MSVKQYDIKNKQKDRSETSKSRRSQRIEGRKNTKQKKSKGSSEVFSIIKEVYNRA